MKCEWVRENIVLFVYNELADDARYELEEHLRRCAECTAELKASRKLHNMLSQLPVEDPTPNLLAASRMRLQEALETAPQGGFWQKLTFDPASWLRQIRYSPALAAAIFIVGFGGGIAATYEAVANKPFVPPSDQPAINESSIAGIRSITRDPASNHVSIHYDTVTAQEAQGSLNDQRIQDLLLYAARNNYNSGVRIDSIDLLTQKPNDGQVRAALIYALRTDLNPGVRLKALDGLGAYVRDDVNVRDALLQALLTDNNQGVRSTAFRLLEPVKADSSVRSVFQKLSENDQNQYLRSQARTVLAQLPEID